MIMFPGQGTQYPGMGKNLYDQFDSAKNLYKKAGNILGERIIDLSFYGNEEDIKDTKNSQPIIFLYSYILFYLKREKKQFPSVQNSFAGHSLGEITALAASGYIRFEEALRLVQFRGEIMAQSSPVKGGMAALLLPKTDEIADYLNNHYKKRIFIANYNSPSQIVISGIEADIQEFCEQNTGKLFRKSSLLKVSQAFHTPFMTDAATEMRKYLNKLSISVNENIIYSNVTGEPYSKDEHEVKELIALQMESPVLWTKLIENSTKKEKQIIEIGPKSILLSMIKSNDDSIELLNFCNEEL